MASVSEESGKLIVSNIIEPSSTPQLTTGFKRKYVRTIKPREVKTVLTEDEKIKIRDDKYREKVVQETNKKL